MFPQEQEWGASGKCMECSMESWCSWLSIGSQHRNPLQPSVQPWRNPLCDHQNQSIGQLFFFFLFFLMSAFEAALGDGWILPPLFRNLFDQSKRKARISANMSWEAAAFTSVQAWVRCYKGKDTGAMKGGFLTHYSPQQTIQGPLIEQLHHSAYLNMNMFSMEKYIDMTW